MRPLLCLALTACGADFDYTTAHGIMVIDETGSIHQAQVESATEAMLGVIGGTGARLQGVRLRIEANPLPLDGQSGSCRYPAVDQDGSPSGRCAGGLSWVDQEYVRVWAMSTCFANSAFVHELCHLFQWWRDDTEDHDHTNEAWWLGEGSVDFRGSMAAFNQECPNE